MSRKRGRPHVRSDAQFTNVVDSIRAEIVSGIRQPGSRIKSWDKLCNEFKVARPTLMRAMAILKEDGFLVPDSTRGTFVAKYPPHRHRHLLVLPPPSPTLSDAESFRDSLRALAASREDSPERVITASPDLAEETLRRLTFASVWLGPDVPSPALPDGMGSRVVGIGWSAPPTTPLSVMPDWKSFFLAAWTDLAAAGCRRPAILSTEWTLASLGQETLGKADIPVQDAWTLATGPAPHPEATGHLARLLLSRQDRPDGLILPEGTLADAVLANLGDLPPDARPRIVAQGMPNSRPGIRCLGFSAEEAVIQAAELAAEAMDGTAPSPRLISVSTQP